MQYLCRVSRDLPLSLVPAGTTGIGTGMGIGLAQHQAGTGGKKLIWTESNIQWAARPSIPWHIK